MNEFTIPPEVLSVERFNSDEKLVSVGNLYQRDQITSLDFKIRLDDLRRPSLLVGAPGSGKSNLALYLLSQLWENHETPFLVLDPSTGHEYRYLLADSKYTQKLKDDLIVIIVIMRNYIYFVSAIAAVSTIAAHGVYWFII